MNASNRAAMLILLIKGYLLGWLTYHISSWRRPPGKHFARVEPVLQGVGQKNCDTRTHREWMLQNLNAKWSMLEKGTS
jgi:hypothetical protein